MHIHMPLISAWSKLLWKTNTTILFIIKRFIIYEVYKTILVFTDTDPQQFWRQTRGEYASVFGLQEEN